MGLLDSFMRGRVDLMNPQAAAMRRKQQEISEQRNYEEYQRKRGLKYAEMMLGAEGRSAVPGVSMDQGAISPQEFQGLPPEMQAEYGTPDQAAVEGTGFLGGQMDASELINRERFNPYKGAQTSGSNLATMMGKQLPTEQKMGPVTFDQYMNFDPQRQAGFDRFKGRNKGPLVTVQTGGGPAKPGPSPGLVPVQNPHGSWRYEVVPGGPEDTKGFKNIRNESEKYRKDIRPFEDALNSVTNYGDLVKKGGLSFSDRTEGGRALAQAQTTALMDLKNVFQLGVLSKDDERLINQILPKGAGGIDYALYSKEQVSKLIERVAKDIKSRGRNIRKQYPNASIADNDSFGPEPEYEYRTLPSGKRQRRRTN